MKNKLLKALWFLRLLDDDKRISLTNISVWITLYQLAIAKDVVSPIDLGALLGALASYQAKRMIGKNGNKKP